MDVGALRKVLKRYGHWRRQQDHVTMLSEAGGAPIGRALTPEEQKRLFETATSHREGEHVYCAAVLAANTSMRGVEVKHVHPREHLTFRLKPLVRVAIQDTLNRLDEAFLFERSIDIDTYDRHAEKLREELTLAPRSSLRAAR
jgi:hypothetical protein